VGVLAALWIAVQNCETSRIDAGAVTDAGTLSDAGASEEAGMHAGAGIGDASTGADAGPSALSPHEREEAAKDELARAREALEQGDFGAAATAIDRARQFDPSNPDIDELEARLPSRIPDGGQ